jgi:uncharacterized LabA/DUF88 family protein
MTRVMIFIDGSNIYWGQNYFSKIHNEKFRIDFRKLIDAVIEKRDLIRTIYYCSVPEKPKESQVKFNDYLRKLGIQIIEKRLRERVNPTNGIQTTTEKGVDIALATDLLAYAWENVYDVAVLVSGDEDYSGAVQKVMTKGKNVELVSFRGSTSKELSKNCTKITYIDDLAGIVKLRK